MPFLETKRTSLRPFSHKDLSSLNMLMTDSEAMKFTGFRKPQSSEKIEECLEKWIEEGAEELGVWCAEEKDTRDFVGWFMLKDTGKEYPELGFMLAKQKWGQGFATEISKELINYAFKKMNLEKVIATTVSENSPSISVLKKIKMTQSKSLVEESGAEILYFEIASYQEKLKGLEGWHFGGKGSGIEDELLELVIKGIKTATCSWYESYAIDKVPLPKVGERSYIMDSSDKPRCIIELTSVEVMPFLDVNVDFAYLEGEGDRSYEHWRAAHEKFFSEYGKKIGLEWDSKIHKVVCEKFRVLEILD